MMMVIPMLILSQVWLFIYNMIAWGGWTGSPGFVQNQQHDDGIMGATANLLRYLFECPDLLWLSDAASRYLIGQPLSGVLQWLYDTTIAPLVGDAGLGRYPFEIVWTTHEDTSGFGPMAFFVALPALGYVLLRGSALLRGIVLIQVVYVFFVAWQVTWSPWKYRFLLFALHLPHRVLLMH
ncbi:MAG: hypothetical protein HC837_08035 [Chloroflexaceae bacterium]|nr:hypothetical protein [Chloroflexaceae bacterium]